MITTVSLVNIHHLTQIPKSVFFLAMRTLRVYPLNIHKQPRAVLTIGSKCAFLVLTYLTTQSLYLLTTLSQFSLLLPSTSGGHKSDLFPQA